MNTIYQTLHEVHFYAPSQSISTEKVQLLLNWASAGHGAQEIAALRSSPTQQWRVVLQNFRTKKNSSHQEDAHLHFTDEETEVQGGPETYLRYHSVHWSANRQSSSLPISPVLRHRGQASIFTVPGCVSRGKGNGPFSGGSDHRDKSVRSSKDTVPSLAHTGQRSSNAAAKGIDRVGSGSSTSCATWSKCPNLSVP